MSNKVATGQFSLCSLDTDRKCAARRSVAQSTGSKGDKDPLEQMSKKELVAEIHKLQGLLKQRDQPPQPPRFRHA